MTPVTRKLALRAAMKVTLAGALVGCENTPPQNAEPTRTQPAADTTLVAGEQCGEGPTQPNLDCCRTMVALFPADDEKLRAAPPNIMGCCKMLVAESDRQLANGNPMWNREARCCYALNRSDGACTPWGPPVPPSMDWV